MKVSPEFNASEAPPAPNYEFQLPQGLIGFTEYTGFTLTMDPEQAPFYWMRLLGSDPIDFVVIEPAGIIPGYEIELFDEDASLLQIKAASDAIVLNIVTVRPGVNATATVNLAAPIVVNRRNGAAKQCILANHTRYSAYHPLVSNDTETAAASGQS